MYPSFLFQSVRSIHSFQYKHYACHLLFPMRTLHWNHIPYLSFLIHTKHQIQTEHHIQRKKQLLYSYFTMIFMFYTCISLTILYSVKVSHPYFIFLRLYTNTSPSNVLAPCALQSTQGTTSAYQENTTSCTNWAHEGDYNIKVLMPSSKNTNAESPFPPSVLAPCF